MRKISPELRRVCAWLKSLGLGFKIKMPVEIGGRWKFADVMSPGRRIVVLVVNPMELAGRPHWAVSDRAEFFKARHRVVEVETLEELKRRIDADPLILRDWTLREDRFPAHASGRDSR